jgi:fumarate hydratase subunit beta
MERIHLQLPLDPTRTRELCAGDLVSLSGVLYSARDAAHQRLTAALDRGEALPLPLKGQTIYYAGPCPARPGMAVGSAGPTTSSRMDVYAPRLIAQGLRGMIGKGLRSRAVIDAMVAHGAVYFGATGGAGALLAQRIVRARVIAYDDLGAEAIRELEVVDFPAIVLIDSLGNNWYEIGPAAWAMPDWTTPGAARETVVTGTETGVK